MQPATTRFSAGIGMAAAALLAATAAAHDTWVQVSRAIVRPDDLVHVDLLLGNHGNEHRDFRIAGKLGSLDGVRLDVVAPDGRRTDLVPSLADTGYAPKEGFWTARHVPTAQGLHCALHLRDGIRHGARGLKGGKAFFLVAERLDAIRASGAGDGFTAPAGHPLELVPETHPVIGCGPGAPVTVRLLHRGRPLADHRVSFIPRGAVLAAGFDPDFERRTDAAGRCSWTPREGNLVLVVAHHEVAEEKGEGYDRTSYSATLVLDVPQRCPCCED